ncbi:MAG: efflux transporter outer membrane subunit [Sphingosinicella sp.]
MRDFLLRTGTLLALAVTGCAPRPQLALAPDLLSTEWSRPPAAGGAALPADLGLALGSPELAALIARAAANNQEMAAATARVRQGRALFRVARGTLLPLVSASAGISASRDAAGDPIDFSESFRGFDVSFDLDLFGVGRAQRRAARERWRANVFDRDALALVIETEMARFYVQRAALAQRIFLLDRGIGEARELERVMTARPRGGTADRVDLGLQTLQLHKLETERLRLAQALDQTRTALAVLLAEEAPRFVLAPAPLAALTVPAIAPVQPGELLVRRPDLRGAEARIRSAGGDVLAARRAFLPRLRLSASGIFRAVTAGDLSGPLSVSADLLAPIFDRGRLNGNLDFAAAFQAESVAYYRQVLLVALREVEDALSAVEHAAAREALLARMVEEARLVARLARARYLAGESGFQPMFEAEQRHTEAEDARAFALQARLEAAIDLFKAMGGSPRSAERVAP